MKNPFFVLFLLFFLSACSGKKPGTLKPERYEAQSVLTIEGGNLKGVFVDNSEMTPVHRAGYNGIAQLYHAQQDSGIFVPAFAGFNLEHIFGGDSLNQLFEPRVNPMTLYRKTSSEVVLYQPPTPLSGVESLTSFKVVEPHYIDITFECIFHNEEFFRHDYAGLFWASYIQKPDDKKIYFRGVPENQLSKSSEWIAAWSEEHGVKSTHKSVNDRQEFFFSEDFNARLASHFSDYRYTDPFFFGRYKNMVLAFLFDGKEIIRFSQSPTGGGDVN
ncbi:MAG TPA: hypothetical protein VFO54_06185, partial [Chryseosolibacter sp.]|nr:hypothetical protein [Chryseosolibacter sp.]